MASFGKLTDYFNRRKSREEVRSGRSSSRRSESYCCTVAEARSLERKLQRPLLAKSRTLPSIPQSPTVSRVHSSGLIGGSPPRRKAVPSTSHPTACTLPPAAELWRLEDDAEGEEAGACRPWLRPQSPFSQLRARAAYLRKSVSVDDHLGMGMEYAGVRGHRASGKAKLKRKFSLGSADRKEAHQKKPESSISKFTHRLSLKERQTKPDKTALDRPPTYRRRSLSLDWAESAKMSQQAREREPPPPAPPGPPAPPRKPASLSSPSAARRLYRNLSGKFRFQSNEALFEAVEHQEMDLVQLLLSQYSLEELDLNTPNSQGLLPLDIAVMTNNLPMAKLLLGAGAKESPHFVSLEGRALHLATLVREAEQRASELRAQGPGGEGPPGEGPGPGEPQGTQGGSWDRERQLRAWEWRRRLFRRMQTGFEHAGLPEAPSGVRLSVSSSSSLRVDFKEPLSVNSAVVTKYRVSWSCAPSLSPVLGELVVEDTSLLQGTITGLTGGTYYYVQVEAYNMKGWGPAQISTPACASPSSWREIDGRAPRQRGQKEALDQLLGQIKEAHLHCVCHEPIKAPPHVRKHSVSKSLRHLFHTSNRCVKNLKRGLYVTTIFYRDDSVLVTPEDHVPVVEVDDCNPSSLNQDFLWFTKLSYLWEEISWLQQCLGSAQSSCSCALQTRLKMLQAAAHLQGMLGTQDLGQVYFEPIKDKHGNALLVLLRDMSTSPALEGVRWTPLCKLQLQRKSISSPEDPTALDALLITLHEKLAYHRRSRKLLSPGLYLGYLKLCSSVDQIRALVPQKLPNVLCHARIRDNGNVSREEWQWLQALSSLEESQEMDQDVQSAPHLLLQELRSAAKDLMNHINIPLSQAKDFRIYTQEVLEFGEQVSFLLLLPPSEEVCTAPGQNNPYSPRSGFLTLPLQIFELVHFDTYWPGFMGQYCRVSALLELEALMAQQALREAFSETELNNAKHKHLQVQEHMQQMEEVWRDARWIMDALQYARYKQPGGGVCLAWIIDLAQEAVQEKPPSTSSSSHPDYLPSPEPCRKHMDFHGLSDEEGSSEVFLTTDSDYDSSRAQSPRDALDLLPSSPLSSSSSSALPDAHGYPHGDGGGGGGALRDSTPDVLQTAEPPPGEKLGGGVVGGGGGGGTERRRGGVGRPELFDSDFILPSRQIELLRITEKRQAFCVRTSSLEFPAAPAPSSSSSSPPSSCHPCSYGDAPPRWPRPSSVERCCPAEACPARPPPPVRTLSEDSGTQRLTACSPGAADGKGWHATLRVYPQYRTGLPKETSVKLRVTPVTSAREMVQLVVQEMNAVSRRLLGGGVVAGGVSGVGGGAPAPEPCGPAAVEYGQEQLEHFGLVLLAEGRERWLQDDFRPLELQNPWLRGRLCVRIKEWSPLALQHGRATTV